MTRKVSSLVIGICFLLFSNNFVHATQGVIEFPDGTASGIGLFYGWLCEASNVTISSSLDAHESRYPIYYGAGRIDTKSICGDTNNGFYTLMNWNIFGDGEHSIRVYADKNFVAQRVFTVVTPRSEFLTGVTGSGIIELSNGLKARVEWSQSMQNFRILEFIDDSSEPEQPDADTKIVYIYDTSGNQSRWTIEQNYKYNKLYIDILPLSNNGFYLNGHLISFRQNGRTYDSQYFYDEWLWYENDGIKHLTNQESLEIELQDGPLTFREPFEMYYDNKLITRFE